MCKQCASSYQTTLHRLHMWNSTWRLVNIKDHFLPISAPHLQNGKPIKRGPELLLYFHFLYFKREYFTLEHAQQARCNLIPMPEHDFNLIYGSSEWVICGRSAITLRNSFYKDTQTHGMLMPLPNLSIVTGQMLFYSLPLGWILMHTKILSLCHL